MIIQKATQQVELLSPAGTLKNMRYAFAYGADAVYAGQPRYSLRVRNNEFDLANLKLGISEAKAQGKKFYIVCNIQPHNSKLKNFIKDIEAVINLEPDALIVSDPGLIMLIQQHFPHMAIHLSVQANTTNWAAVKFWQKQNIERIILSRELSLEEIEDIKKQAPEMELEVFVHGALCMAYSGRCLLSGYINKRDANQGTCTNSCRWKYKIYQADEDDTGNLVEKSIDKSTNTQEINELAVLLEETGRAGELLPTFEDMHGTYIMNSRDLRAIRHVERLIKMGVQSLKIEGRTKSFYYCARTAQIYRKAIDDALAGKPFDTSLETGLEALAHRGYTEGFLRRHILPEETQHYEYGHSMSELQQFVGEFTGNTRGELAEVEVKNRFELGDRVEIMTTEGNTSFLLSHIEDEKGSAIDAGKGSSYKVFIPVPEGVSLEMSLLMRYLPTNATTRNPNILAVSI